MIKTMEIPFGRQKQLLHLDESRIAAVLRPAGEEGSGADQAAIVREALGAPIGSPRLMELARDARRVLVITSDHTRPVPSRITMPPLLEEIRRGRPDAEISILIATGMHRPTTREELIAKLGAEIVEAEHIVVHNAYDAAAMAHFGTLPSGGELWLNALLRETDLVVAEGFIEPHFFAGFSGGRKSVLPGVCDAVTVMGNHCSKFIASPNARTGVLDGNPLHNDMVDAARQAKLAYIVNVVIDEEKRVVAAFAGDPFEAHKAGTEFLAGQCRVKAVPADIVITGNGGAPLDQNMYQAVKSMTAAEACANEGGVIIECAECIDGTGGEGFYRALKDCESAQALMDEILQVPQKETKPDQWEYQIQARILIHHPVIYVSCPQMRETIEEMKMMYAETLDEALEKAREIVGEDAKVTVIPNGISVIVAE